MTLGKRFSENSSPIAIVLRSFVFCPTKSMQLVEMIHETNDASVMSSLTSEAAAANRCIQSAVDLKSQEMR